MRQFQNEVCCAPFVVSFLFAHFFNSVRLLVAELDHIFPDYYFFNRPKSRKKSTQKYTNSFHWNVDQWFHRTIDIFRRLQHCWQSSSESWDEKCLASIENGSSHTGKRTFLSHFLSDKLDHFFLDKIGTNLSRQSMKSCKNFRAKKKEGKHHWIEFCALFDDREALSFKVKWTAIKMFPHSSLVYECQAIIKKKYAQRKRMESVTDESEVWNTQNWMNRGKGKAKFTYKLCACVNWYNAETKWKNNKQTIKWSTRK